MPFRRWAAAWPLQPTAQGSAAAGQNTPARPLAGLLLPASSRPALRQGGQVQLQCELTLLPTRRRDSRRGAVAHTGALRRASRFSEPVGRQEAVGKMRGGRRCSSDRRTALCATAANRESAVGIVTLAKLKGLAGSGRPQRRLCEFQPRELRPCRTMRRSPRGILTAGRPAAAPPPSAWRPRPTRAEARKFKLVSEAPQLQVTPRVLEECSPLNF